MNTEPGQRTVVLTVDIGDDSVIVGATLTDHHLGRIEPLPVPAPGSADASGGSPQLILADALDRAAVASARATGVVSAPDTVVLTHPAAWTPAQIETLHTAAADAGFPPHRVIVHAMPAGRDPTDPGVSRST